MTRFNRAMIGVVLLAAAGCLGEGQVQLIDAPAAAIGPVTLQVLPESADLSVADALGWRAGIPGAQVVVHTPAGDQAGVTDAAGKLALSLEAGSFVIEVNRVLSDAEAQRVPAAEGALGFALVSSVSTGGSGPVPVRVTTARKHGLIVSEWAFNPGLVPGGGIVGYSFSGFLELYNNGDTTVYLDGMLVGEAFTFEFKPSFATCQDYERLKYDPQYLWTSRIERFPGRGRDYPVVSGGVVVLATDAIDHRPMLANGLDLSHADFELIGSSDVDNPAVPNMTEEGRQDLLGHGLIPGATGATVTYLALPVDLATMPTQRTGNLSNPPSDNLYWGIPRASLLSVYSHVQRGGTAYPPCLPLLLPLYDQESASLTGDGGDRADFLVSHARRLFVERGGRKYLLSTHSSRTDFVRGTRTAGAVP